MESQTSFIPKKPLAKESVVREHPIGLFSVIATILFFASLLAAGGVFAYKTLLTRDIETAKRSLEKAEQAFEPATIVELERLDARIESSKKLLEAHTVVTPVFRLLESLTIPQVRFGKFGFSLLSGDKIELRMGGEARSYAFVALQSEQFGNNKYLKDVIFSDLNLDQAGNVTFAIDASVDPDLIRYGSQVERGDIAPLP